MIIWAHIACMTTDPGTLPKHYKEINESLLLPEVQPVWMAVKEAIKRNLQFETNSEEIKTSDGKGNVDMSEIKEHMKSANSELVELLQNPDIEQDGNLDPHTEEKLIVMFKNHCYACDSLKPPRSHHCRTCRRCIAKMDHH